MDAEKYELLLAQARAYLSLANSLKSTSFNSYRAYLNQAKKCVDLAAQYRQNHLDNSTAIIIPFKQVA